MKKNNGAKLVAGLGVVGGLVFIVSRLRGATSQFQEIAGQLQNTGGILNLEIKSTSKLDQSALFTAPNNEQINISAILGLKPLRLVKLTAIEVIDEKNVSIDNGVPFLVESTPFINFLTQFKNTLSKSGITLELNKVFSINSELVDNPVVLDMLKKMVTNIGVAPTKVLISIVGNNMLLQMDLNFLVADIESKTSITKIPLFVLIENDVVLLKLIDNVSNVIIQTNNALSSFTQTVKKQLEDSGRQVEIVGV